MSKTFFSLILAVSMLSVFAQNTFCPSDLHKSSDCSTNNLTINFVEKIIQNIKSTKYQHEEEVLEIEEGVFFTNCSGFANFILLNLRPAAYSALEVEKDWCWQGNPRPRAAAYYKAFIDSDLSNHTAYQHWQRIKNIMDSKPGDFLAWQEDSFDDNSNSGHVLIIAGTPQLLEDGTVSVDIIDASRHPHSNDTRKVFSGGGVGKGTMRFKINADGEPLGFHWSLKPSKVKLRKTAIGRLKLYSSSPSRPIASTGQPSNASMHSSSSCAFLG